MRLEISTNFFICLVSTHFTLFDNRKWIQSLISDSKKFWLNDRTTSYIDKKKFYTDTWWLSVVPILFLGLSLDRHPRCWWQTRGDYMTRGDYCTLCQFDNLCFWLYEWLKKKWLRHRMVIFVRNFTTLLKT